jgi:hypothetical protein
MKPRITQILGWRRDSYLLLSGFLLLLFLLGYVWWPLAEDYLSFIDWRGAWWVQIDWLLLGIFAGMSLLIMARAELSRDIKIVLVGFVGGFVIESWGTQTQLWTYYTNERPPLWIIPAWPIASLAIDRLARVLKLPLSRMSQVGYRRVYIALFALFGYLMVIFVRHTFDKSMTWFAIFLCAWLILIPENYEKAVHNFIGGTALGLFLEYWGTTRLCWSYYTFEQPPLFAVFAHGMAAVAFWRAGFLLESMLVFLHQRSKLIFAKISERNQGIDS